MRMSMMNHDFGDMPAGEADHRCALRRAVTFKAKLRDRSSSRFDIAVLDLSATGFRAEVDYSLDPGAIVWIALPGLQGLEATVAWRRGTTIGAAFRQPLYPAVFEHIVALAARA